MTIQAQPEIVTLMPTLTEHVTAEIRAELARQRRRQRYLAPVLRVSEPQVSERLNGRIPLTLRELELIAEALGRPVASFLPDDTQATAAAS